MDAEQPVVEYGGTPEDVDLLLVLWEELAHLATSELGRVGRMPTPIML